MFYIYYSKYIFKYGLYDSRELYKYNCKIIGTFKYIYIIRV